MPFYRTREAKLQDIANQDILDALDDEDTRSRLAAIYNYMSGVEWNADLWELVSGVFNDVDIKFLDPTDLVDTKEEMEWDPNAETQ